MGKLIIFEGLDGSGKGTQAALTAQKLRQRGVTLRQVTFPDYDSESSALVKMYLSGRFGQKPDDVNAYAASSFYAVDRFASYKTDWGGVLPRGRPGAFRPVYHLQRRASVLQTAACPVGRVPQLAVRF